VDAYKPKEIEKAITELIAQNTLSLLVVQGLCVILRRRRQRKEKANSEKIGI